MRARWVWREYCAPGLGSRRQRERERKGEDDGERERERERERDMVCTVLATRVGQKVREEKVIKFN